MRQDILGDSGASPLSTEAARRREDRVRVKAARQRKAGGRLALAWLLIGPGILAMLGENDSPSMISYAATGDQFGIGFFLPFIVLTFVMAFIVQETTVRLAASSRRGHARLILERFGPFWGRFAVADLLLGNFLTLITEFIGVRSGLGYFGVPASLAVGFGSILVISILAAPRYFAWERSTLGLAAVNLIFVPIALLAHPNFQAIGHAFATFGPLPNAPLPSFMTLVMADIGATVTPWMIYFQQSAVVDKGLAVEDVPMGRFDTALGAALAALVAVAATVTTASLVGQRISPALERTADFAAALAPHIGGFGAALFAIGLIEAGVVAATTISTSSAYALGEALGIPSSLNRPIREAPVFYAAMAGSVLLAATFVMVPGVPLEVVVLFVNVVAVLAMPPALVFLYLLANDPLVMAGKPSRPAGRIALLTVTLLISFAGIFYALSTLSAPAP